MWWPENEVGVTCSFAGLDDAAASEVRSAVEAYCRLRHGTDQLPRDYLFFLYARTSHGLPAPEKNTSDRVALCRELEPVAGDRAFVRALVHADDPGELAEAYRRKLVWVSSSDLFPGRCILNISLKKIAVDPARDLPVAWAPVLRRIARWTCDWRAGNSELQSLKIAPHPAWFGAWPEAREMMESALRMEESAREISPSDLIWAV